MSRLYNKNIDSTQAEEDVRVGSRKNRGGRGTAAGAWKGWEAAEMRKSSNKALKKG